MAYIKKFASISLNVDSGIIAVMPLKFFGKYIEKDIVSSNGLVINTMMSGNKEVKLNILDTWNGKITVKGKIIVDKDDTVYIGDPCYIVKGELWSEFLKNYIFGKEGSGVFFYCDAMGGDGCFKTNIYFLN